MFEQIKVVEIALNKHPSCPFSSAFLFCKPSTVLFQINKWNCRIAQLQNPPKMRYSYINVSFFQILWHNSDSEAHHTCGLFQPWKKALIDPKRHSIHSAQWQPSLFSKESTLSLLHSSRASPSAWWIMSSVSSETRLIPDRYTTLYKMVLTACRSQRGQTCQQAIGLNSLSMMRCLGWF